MTTKSYLKVAVVSALLSIPFFTYAATDFGSLGSLVNNFTKNVVTSVGYLFLSTAVVVFFLGVVQFIWASRGGEANGMEKGKSFMMWGLVALFVMFSVWGIIKFAQNILGPEFQTTEIIVPTLRFSPNGAGPAPATPLGSPASGGLPNGSNCSDNSMCASNNCRASTLKCEP